jgi:hypothetical protein
VKLRGFENVEGLLPCVKISGSGSRTGLRRKCTRKSFEFGRIILGIEDCLEQTNTIGPW